MARRARNPFLARAVRRTLGAWTRSAMRTGTKRLGRVLRDAARPSKSAATKRKVAASTPARARPLARAARAKPLGAPASLGATTSGVATAATGVRRYRLFKPDGVKASEHLPLVVMLHGCAQDADVFALSIRMNRLAQRARFMVLYPEQDRLSNAQRCWNWYDTRSGRAPAEAAIIEAAIRQVLLLQPVDPSRIALAGLSAGAGMAALLALREPARYCALAMHSGVPPGLAHSTATALGAMRGRRSGAPLAPLPDGQQLPALLVIQGSADPIVAPSNAVEAVRLWAQNAGATAGPPRTVQRGKRYAAHITDYRVGRRLVATLCLVDGLGHAWSGGAARQLYSDPKGPDASRMIWAFAAKQFGLVVA